MELIGQNVLLAAGRRNKPLMRALQVWSLIVQQSDWKNLADVRLAYPSADGVSLRSATVVTILNIKGNEYRLVTWIDYRAGIVEVLAVMTHAEYSRDRWKEKY